MELCGYRGFAGPSACVKEQGHEGPHVYGNFRQAIDDELRKDAERYRYMRDNAAFQNRNGPGLYWYLPRWDSDLPIGERLDRAIDAKMQTPND